MGHTTVMQIRYADGTSAECMIIRLAGRALRAVVSGTPDTVEYRLILDDWVSERGEVVWFEFASGLPRELYSITPQVLTSDAECAAGGDCMLRRIAGGFDGPCN